MFKKKEERGDTPTFTGPRQRTARQEGKKKRKKNCGTKLVARGGGFLDLGSAYRPDDWAPNVPSRSVLAGLGVITWKLRHPWGIPLYQRHRPSPVREALSSELLGKPNGRNTMKQSVHVCACQKDVGS